MGSPKPYQNVTRCRICGNAHLESLLDLGEMALSGVFPKSPQQPLTCGPLELVKCAQDAGGDGCGLVQLRQTYDLVEMYGEHYGYRSGLNASMVRHLHDIAGQAFARVKVSAQDLIVDIGSNDATLLKAYPDNPATRVGIDPLIKKFHAFYPDGIEKIPDFFSASLVKGKLGGKKAKIITSIAMFYDLEAPQAFVNNIADILHDEGIWLFEQSYMPAMIEANAYDTICHEHLEYYGLGQIHRMLSRAGLKIVDVQFNETNGGSFLVTAARRGAAHPECTALIQSILENEKIYETRPPYDRFKTNIETHRDELVALLRQLKAQGKRVLGYGASTKGNILLQYCGLTPNEVECMAEVNEEKYGAVTPRTNIPIVPEKEARASKPDYFLVLPWHFKAAIVQKEEQAIRQGIRFIFPLPRIEVV